VRFARGARKRTNSLCIPISSPNRERREIYNQGFRQSGLRRYLWNRSNPLILSQRVIQAHRQKSKETVGCSFQRELHNTPRYPYHQPSRHSSKLGAHPSSASPTCNSDTGVTVTIPRGEDGKSVRIRGGSMMPKVRSLGQQFCVQERRRGRYYVDLWQEGRGEVVHRR